jgi:nucleotide-binding universal stress UspA family protein
MVVPAGYAAPGRIRVIEVGFDGSAESRAALGLARDLALRAQATLRVIAVGAAAPSTDAPIDRPVAHPHLEEQLHDAVAQLPPELRALPVFARGEAAAQLLDRADEGVDLVVIGSRTYGPLRSVLLGSVSTMVIERAPCPVIVTPRPGQGPGGS